MSHGGRPGPESAQSSHQASNPLGESERSSTFGRTDPTGTSSNHATQPSLSSNLSNSVSPQEDGRLMILGKLEGVVESFRGGKPLKWKLSPLSFGYSERTMMSHLHSPKRRRCLTPNSLKSSLSSRRSTSPEYIWMTRTQKDLLSHLETGETQRPWRSWLWSWIQQQFPFKATQTCQVRYAMVRCRWRHFQEL